MKNVVLQVFRQGLEVLRLHVQLVDVAGVHAQALQDSLRLRQIIRLGVRQQHPGEGLRQGLTIGG